MQSEFAICNLCHSWGARNTNEMLTIFFPTRFLWLVDFLNYLKNWKESTDNRQRNFTQNARSCIFISWQIYEGFQISVLSVNQISITGGNGIRSN